MDSISYTPTARRWTVSGTLPPSALIDTYRRLGGMWCSHSQGTLLFCREDRGRISPRNIGEERKLRVFENMVLRRMFGPRRGEVTGEWRRLHNKELNDLYSSPNIVWVIKYGLGTWRVWVRKGGA